LDTKCLSDLFTDFKLVRISLMDINGSYTVVAPYTSIH